MNNDKSNASVGIEIDKTNDSHDCHDLLQKTMSLKKFIRANSYRIYVWGISNNKAVSLTKTADFNERYINEC